MRAHCATAQRQPARQGWRTSSAHCGTSPRTNLARSSSRGKLVVGRGVAMHAQGDSSGAQSLSCRRSEYGYHRADARRTTTRRSSDSTEGYRTGRRTSAASRRQGSGSWTRRGRQMVLRPQHHQPKLLLLCQAEDQWQQLQRQRRQRLQPSSIRASSEHNGGDYIGGCGGLPGRILDHGEHGGRTNIPGEANRGPRK